jgi:hypothetical protein
MRRSHADGRRGALALLGVLAVSASFVEGAEPAEPEPLTTVTCSSPLGGRAYCPANTSMGIVLRRSTGDAPCLLGKTWGYDDGGVWVSDGCSAEFVISPTPAPTVPPPTAVPGPAPTPAPMPPQIVPPAGPGPDVVTTAEEPAIRAAAKSPTYIPNAGFRLITGEQGEIYLRLYSYVRYLNQKGLDPFYVDSFGNVHDVPIREDVQLNKVFIPFSGWFLTPRFRYYLYVWSQNPAQGEGAQVVAAGNLSYVFNRFLTLGGGITSLPSTRSTEGQFPYWLGVDDRLTSDEFFRGSYTEGFWIKGEILSNLKYMAMAAVNLSILGVSASQLDQGLNTQSFMLAWMPTTGEFGLYGTFGDYDYHEKIATRIGAHWTHSREDKQDQPGTNSIENTQIRLTDGNIVFTPDLFGPGIVVERVTYEMMSIDAGIKYKGFSLEGEFFQRWLSNFDGLNTGGIADIVDHGYQLQASAMVIPRKLQVYVSGAQIFGGPYGDDSEFRAGLNWYFMKERGLRFNGEFIRVHRSPVGYTAYPLPVGGTGDVINLNLEMNF